MILSSTPRLSPQRSFAHNHDCPLLTSTTTIMNSTTSLLNAYQQQYLANTRPVYYSPKHQLLTIAPDNILALAAPVIAYWSLSLVFHFLDISNWKWLDKYRIHESAEVQSRNLVTIGEVIRAVFWQHVVQTIIGYWWVEELPVGDQVDHMTAMNIMLGSLYNLAKTVAGEKAVSPLFEKHAHELVYAVYWWAIPTAKFFLGMYVSTPISRAVFNPNLIFFSFRIIIYTWQYFLHRAMHMNTYLYKKLHSVHHRLYVPYAFGALYNHPLEGFLLDTLGAGIAEFVVGMSTREAMLLFTVSTLKTVDDHCGYSLPYDPLQMFSGNNADYHDIHHQVCAF